MVRNSPGSLPGQEVFAGEPAGEQTASQISDEIMLAEVQSERQTSTRARPSVCDVAIREYNDPSSDLFKVTSGPYKNYPVPVALRCAITQSKFALEAGLIGPSDVTIRALEFEQKVRRLGFHKDKFEPGRSYPNGTYIVGEGARDGTNSRHVAVVCGNQLIHTSDGRLVKEPISAKFFGGAYDRMTVWRPR